MNELVASTYVKTGMTLQNLRDRLDTHRERGADALEYVGMFIVAGLIVAAVVGAIGNIDFGGIFTKAVAKVTGLGG